MQILSTEQLQSRKFIATIVLYLTSTASLFLNSATFSEWSTFSLILLGIYCGANAADKYQDLKKESTLDK